MKKIVLIFIASNILAFLPAMSLKFKDDKLVRIDDDIESVVKIDDTVEVVKNNYFYDFVAVDGVEFYYYRKSKHISKIYIETPDYPVVVDGRELRVGDIFSPEDPMWNENDYLKKNEIWFYFRKEKGSIHISDILILYLDETGTINKMLMLDDTEFI